MQELLYSNCFGHVQTQSFSVGLRAVVLQLCGKTCCLNLRIFVFVLEVVFVQEDLPGSGMNGLKRAQIKKYGLHT